MDRAQLEKEINIVRIVQNQRCFHAATGELLSEAQRIRLKLVSHFQVLDPDESKANEKIAPLQQEFELAKRDMYDSRRSYSRLLDD